MINRLAHVEVGVSDLERAYEFYVGVLGFKEHMGAEDALYLRATHEFDEWSLKLTEAGGPGVLSIGFRVAAPEDLQELAELHQQLGLRHAALPGGFHPGRGPGLRVAAPSGHVLDFHHEIDEVDMYGPQGTPMPPMRRVGSSAGVPPAELDHVNLRTTCLPETICYFTDELHFSISEYVVNEDGERYAAWMRRSRTTHEVAVLGYEHAGMHHFAFVVPDGAALVRTSDLLADAGHGDRVQFGPGRHGATNALAMYFLDPDGNRIEFYCGDYHRDLDRPPIVWSHNDFVARGRFLWGGAPDTGFPIPTPLLEAPWPEPATTG